MKSRLTLLALAWLILSCSGTERVTTFVPSLQEVADSILLDLYSEPPVSAYAVGIDREGRILCWTFWEKPNGHLIKDPYLFRPAGLFKPVLDASDMMGEVLEDMVKEWFPHAVPLWPVNAPPAQNSRETFLGETMVVPAAEIAAFYGAVAHGGLLATPRLTPDRSLHLRRIMPEYVADSLKKTMAHSNEKLGCHVSGQSGLTEIPMENDGTGVVSSFVGTFDLASYGQVTLLVALTVPSDVFRPEENALVVFEKMIRSFKEKMAINVNGE